MIKKKKKNIWKDQESVTGLWLGANSNKKISTGTIENVFLAAVQHQLVQPRLEPQAAEQVHWCTKAAAPVGANA